MDIINITPIAEALIALLAALVTAFVLPWIKKKIGAENMSEFLAWVDIAVAAAEQLFDSTDGAAKKQYVAVFLESMGFKLDAQALDNAIEAAVIRLHNDLYGAVTIAAAGAAAPAEEE